MLSSRGFLGVLALASTSSFVSGTLYASPYGTFNVGNGDAFGVPGNATYDYVIVGGGTAGLGVAYRLAESGNYSVAVVEAGGFYQFENGNQSVVPLRNSEFASLNSPKAIPLVDWGFVTTPQAGANNRSLHYARGKTLGGSSALNANIYNRGTKGSLQMWADLVGDASYEFDNWLPYYTRGINYSETNTMLRAANASVPSLENTAVFSPSGGPVQVSYSNFALPFSSWAQKGFQYFGFPNRTSLSGGELLGSQYAPSVLDATTNQRDTSETGYLNAALRSNRTNLYVYTHSLATKVLFSNNKTATGIMVKSNRFEYLLQAKKEIILSAGAFQSPQLLMVSGIGPAAALDQHNISVIADRPGVGQNMWDHPDLEVTWKVDVVGQNSLADLTFMQEQTDGFNARPPVSIYGSYGVDYIGWEKIPEPFRSNLSSTARDQLAAFPADWPEAEYEVASVITSDIPGDYSGYGTFVVINVAPLSRGTVTIDSSSMEDPPIINPNWNTAQTDKEVFLQAVKRARQILSSAALAPIRLGTEYTPGDGVQTDAELEEYIQNNLFMNWHAACTCKMGMVNDAMAVVDSRARVIGVNNLRVVDASSFALLPPGHPTSTVYGLAEKISADIIRTHQM